MFALVKLLQRANFWTSFKQGSLWSIISIFTPLTSASVVQKTEKKLKIFKEISL